MADTDTVLYNGLHKVVFKDNSHRYYVNGDLKPGVTTAISSVLAKPSLMLWPMDMALKYLRDKLPAITEDDLEESRKAHVLRRDKGANTGSIVHELVENMLMGQPVDLTGQPSEVLKAIGGFDNWLTGAKPEVVAVEQIIYSQEHEYCGTFDSILKMDGKTFLTDLKTTNVSREAPQGVYPEYFVQLGAYATAYDEQREYENMNGGTKLVHIDDLMILSCKKNGQVDTKTASDLDLTVQDCKDLWKAVLFLSKQLKAIQKELQL